MTTSFVLGTQESSTYPEGTAAILAFPAALSAERRVAARRGRVGETIGSC